MNGECKAYRLNEPLTWKEFKSMPEDLQVCYIKALIERYDPSTTTMAEMFKIHYTRVTDWMRKHGMGKGKGAKCHFQKEAWEKWLAGGKEQAEPVEVIPEMAQDDTETEKASHEYVGGVREERFRRKDCTRPWGDIRHLLCSGRHKSKGGSPECRADRDGRIGVLT